MKASDLEAVEADFEGEEAPAHHEISPSSLYQLLGEEGLRCVGAVQAQRGLEDTESEAAIDGTRTHMLAEEVLLEWRDEGKPPVAMRKLGKEYIGMRADEYRCVRAQAYIDFVVETVDFEEDPFDGTPPDILLVERRIDLSSVLPGWFGTADVVIISARRKEVSVIDLKDGRIEVEARGNPQPRAYALGAIETAVNELGIEVETFHAGIVQPKAGGVKEAWMTIDELMDWRDNALKPALDLALADNPPRLPGPKQCSYCKAAGDCIALARASLSVALAQLQPLDMLGDPDARPAVRGETTISHEMLGDLLPLVKMVEGWAGALRERADQEASAGRVPPRHKRIAGKRGARKWRDEDRVKAFASKALPAELVYETRLKSPTQLLAQRKLIDDDVLEVLEELTYAPEGKPKVVHESDRRPSIDDISSDEDFDCE